MGGDKWAPYEELVPYMVAFDAGGGVRWSVAGEEPDIAVAGGGVIGKSGIVYDPGGNATGMGVPTTYSWPGNAYRTGSVDLMMANSLYYGLSFWAFQGANQSRNNTARFRRDSRANDSVKKKLTAQFWRRFALSHCGSVLANTRGMTAMIPSYSLDAVRTKQAITNFYDLGNPGVGGLTLREGHRGWRLQKSFTERLFEQCWCIRRDCKLRL